MNQYAQLTLLRGKCNSMGLPEIEFRYPLKTDREFTLRKRAEEVYLTYHFQVGFFWALIDPENYNIFKERVSHIHGCSGEHIFVPKSILHGHIYFDLRLQFNDVTPLQKEKLVDQIVRSNIHPSEESLDMFFSSKRREMQYWQAPMDEKELANEEKRTFARNLHFFTE